MSSYYKEQRCLKNYLKGIHLLGITCPDPVVSLSIVYKFVCELCGHSWSGTVNIVNGAGCPNRHSHILKRKNVCIPPNSYTNTISEELDSSFEDYAYDKILDRGAWMKCKYENKSKSSVWKDTTILDITNTETKDENSDADSDEEELSGFITNRIIPQSPDIHQMYMTELKNKSIICLQQDTSNDKNNWWRCSVCEYTWQEQFKLLVSRLDNSNNPCINCVEKTRANIELKRTEIKKYLSELKSGSIECLDKSVSTEDTNKWRCLKCHATWENNFNSIVYPYNGCATCKGIELKMKCQDIVIYDAECGADADWPEDDWGPEDPEIDWGSDTDYTSPSPLLSTSSSPTLL